MNFKRKLALFLCGAMLAQPVCVTADEAAATPSGDQVTSGVALERRSIPYMKGCYIVDHIEETYIPETKGYSGYRIENEKGEPVTGDYMGIRIVSGKLGLFEGEVPAGMCSTEIHLFKIENGKTTRIADLWCPSYRCVEAGEASFFFGAYSNGKYYDLNGNRIEDLGVYLKPYGISLERDKWAEEAIIHAWESDFMPPNLGYNYRNAITRGEFCRLAITAVEKKNNALGYEDTEYKKVNISYDLPSPFTDVDDCYINAAASLGIVKGVGGGRFEPDRPITRQEAAVLLCNLAKVIQLEEDVKKLPTFADDKAIEVWAKPSVYKICGMKAWNGDGYGIMLGTGKNKFSPAEQYTREQAIVTIEKMVCYHYKNYPRKDGSLP